MLLDLLCLCKKVIILFTQEYILVMPNYWAWLCCIYELQELTFLQLCNFYTGG